MALKRGRGRLVVDPTDFELIRNEVGVGEIRELRSQDAGLVVPHLASHPETVYIAASGIPPRSHFHPTQLDEASIAIEWVRQETRPLLNEPELNSYRYILASKADGKVYRYETPNVDGGADGRVGEHWTTLDRAYRAL